MKNAEYWASRAKWRQNAYDRAGDKAIETVRRAYNRAYKQTQEDIEKIIGTYAYDNDFSRVQAMKMLQANAGRDAIERLREEATTIDDPVKRAETLKNLDASYYAGRITRKEAILESARVQLTKAAVTEIATDGKLLRDIAKDGFARTLHDVQKAAGYGFSMSDASLRRIENVLKTTWTGKQFSARVWHNTRAAAASASKAVMENILVGSSTRKTWDDLLKNCDGSVMAANRIMRTEMNYVTGQAELEAFEEAEIERYRFTVVFDGRVCERCAPLDGQVFAVKDQRVGVNMHPMHPFCRCGVSPILPFEVEEGQRWARRISDGKEEKIPDTITYTEWKKQFAKEKKE